jgi:hypothetical protein
MDEWKPSARWKPSSKEQAIEDIARLKISAVIAGTNRLPFVVYYELDDDVQGHFFTCLDDLADDLKTKAPKAIGFWVGHDENDGVPLNSRNILTVEWLLTKRYASFTSDFWKTMLRRSFSTGPDFRAYDGPYTPWSCNDLSSVLTVAESLKLSSPLIEGEDDFLIERLGEMAVVTRSTLRDLVDQLKQKVDELINEDEDDEDEFDGGTYGTENLGYVE